MVLSDYLAALRDILHDPNAQNWTDAQLTRYINEGRNRISQDTKCLRQVVTGISLTTNQEAYDISTTTAGFGSFDGRIIDVMGITLYWGSVRYPLSYLAWTVLDARYRYWKDLRSRPEAFTRMGALSVYIAPIPDQDYQTDWILAVNPIPLVDDTTVEEVPVPFTEPVVYWAAYVAKFGEQALGEANIFKNEYLQRRQMVQRSFMTLNIPYPYANANT